MRSGGPRGAWGGAPVAVPASANDASARRGGPPRNRPRRRHRPRTPAAALSAAALGALGVLILARRLPRSFRLPVLIDPSSVEGAQGPEDDAAHFLPEVELRIASWNLALCAPSAAAPAAWTAWDQRRALRRELLASDPHVVALQEAPHAAFDPFTLEDPGNEEEEEEEEDDDDDDTRARNRSAYVPIGAPRRSHKGFVLLFLRRDWAGRATPLAQELPPDLPAVVAELRLPPPRPVAAGATGPAVAVPHLHVASVHLDPSPRRRGRRLAQLEALRAALALRARGGAERPPALLLLAGDTNLREPYRPPDRPTGDKTDDDAGDDDDDDDDARDESRALRRHGWQDAWVAAGADPASRFTWDTVDHRADDDAAMGYGGGHVLPNGTAQRRGGGYWNLYHGPDTTQMLQRYDRVYYHLYDDDDHHHGTSAQGAQAAHAPVVRVRVVDFGLFAAAPLGGGGSRTHFLSDHFGVRATLRIATTAP